VVFDGGLPMDAGLVTDGGVIDDGGVATDAGLPGSSPDGGLSSEPLRFSTCGCGPSGDPALALFGALLFFAARRRRTS
jgi:MYXO-CTERM domain-containing protein